MPVSWNYYLRLRNTSTKEYIVRKGIESYEQLLLGINQKDVEPPSEEEVKEHFISRTAPVPPAKSASISKKDEQKTDISKRKPKSRTRKKATTSKK